MNVVKIRKNFVFDKEIVDKAQSILKEQQLNFTEVISLYFKAIVKDPTILKTIEKSANKRTGSFIGLLDGKVGDEGYKEMKTEYLQETKKF